MDNIDKNKPMDATFNVDEASDDKDTLDDSTVSKEEELDLEVEGLDLAIDESLTQETKNEEVDKPSFERLDQKVTLTYPTSSEGKLTSSEELNLPSNFDLETREVLDSLPNISIIDSPETRIWGNTISEGLEYNTLNEQFVKTLEDDKADFNNGLEINGVSLLGQPPKFKPIENQNLKGDRAIIRVITQLGLGSLFQVPLWHTGIWITFKPPTESEIIELNRVLISDKIKFGRFTYGLAFTNSTSYTVRRLVDFAINHIYDTTIKSEEVSNEDLINHISCQDIPSLLWGFACTMYPKGFNYKRGCITDPEKCNYLLEEILNISKLQWTNRAALTDWQKSFMSGRQSKTKDLSSIKRYKEELVSAQKERLQITSGDNEPIYITIKSPSISEYVAAGYRWIDDIVDTVERALGADAVPKDRDSLIRKHGQATTMRQYSHWVDSIEIGSNIIDDRETIERTLNQLSSDDVIRTKFIDSTFKYIDRSTVSVIGIPVYDCPSCGNKQSTSSDLPHHTNIIPLDVIQVFSGLLIQRLNKMTER